jgi:RNA polymerase sigma-70 factor (ECF subfamily)
LTHWYYVRCRYDDAKPAAKKTFMRHVFENKIFDLLEQRVSVKRKAMYQNISLDGLIAGLDEDEYPDELSFEDQNFEEVLRSDIGRILKQAMSKLSGRQREMCRLIKVEGMNMNQVSQKMNIPRGTLFDEVLRIREVFRNEGLTDYLR